jgi:hypothetical protein
MMKLIRMRAYYVWVTSTACREYREMNTSTKDNLEREENLVDAEENLRPQGKPQGAMTPYSSCLQQRGLTMMSH